MDILEKNEVIKIMKELHIPHIYNSEKLIGYGGNQDWFEDEWAQKAGCASVLASNMYAYYQHQETFSKNQFLSIMNSMFKNMTPGQMGYPFLYKFARTFVDILGEEGIYLQPVYQKKSKDTKHALSFVLKHIDEGHPIGMLILYHRAPELKDDNWHWVCLSGYIETKDGYDIIFSDCGERRIINADILFDTHCHNVYKMVSMKKDPIK